MKEFAINHRDMNNARFAEYCQAMPQVSQAYEALPAAVFVDGAVSAKHKRLMALAGALVHGCLACQLYQTEEALKLGATVAEVLETCSVAISLGGTMAAGETTQVVSLLRELGLM